MAYIFLGLIIFVVVYRLLSKSKRNQTETLDNEYTPLDDIYEGKANHYSASPIIETTREFPIEEMDDKRNSVNESKKTSS